MSSQSIKETMQAKMLVFRNRFDGRWDEMTAEEFDAHMAEVHYARNAMEFAELHEELSKGASCGHQ